MKWSEITQLKYNISGTRFPGTFQWPIFNSSLHSNHDQSKGGSNSVTLVFDWYFAIETLPKDKIVIALA